MKKLAAINTFTYYVEQAFLLIISLNRFILLCTRLKDYHLKIVTVSVLEIEAQPVQLPNTLDFQKIFHAAAWIYGFLLTLIPSFFGCFKIFTPRILTFTFGCGSCGGLEQTYVIAGLALH